MRRLGVSGSSIADRYREGPQQAPPYVARTVDQLLERSLDTHRFTVLSGPSKAGKSRTALEFAARALPDHQLIVPRVRRATHELLRQELLNLCCLPDEPTVLWLDDLDRYLAEDAFLDEALFELTLQQRPGLRILGTLQVATMSLPRVRQVSATIHRVDLLGRLTPDEWRRATVLYPNEDLGRNVRLGEYFVAADDLVARFESAADDSDTGLGPLGGAVVSAAIDLRRVGISRAIPRDALWRLFAGIGCDSYVRLGGRSAGRLTKAAFEAALDVAAEPIASSIALLIPTPDFGTMEAYDPFDFIVAYARGETEFVVEPSMVPVAAYIVALEDLVAGAEDYAVIAGLVSRSHSMDVSEQLRVAQSVSRAVERGGVGVNAVLIAVKELSRTNVDGLLDALPPIAEQALATEWPRTNVLLPTVDALLRSGRPDRAQPIVNAVQRHIHAHPLSPSLLARFSAMLIRGGGLAGAEETLDRLDMAMLDPKGALEPVAPWAAITLLDAMPSDFHASQSCERIERLLSTVSGARVEAQTRARVLLTLLGSPYRDMAPYLIEDVVASIAKEHINTPFAAKVAHDLSRAHYAEEAAQVFDVLISRLVKGTMPARSQGEVILRLLRAGRVATAEDLVATLCERYERSPPPYVTVASLTTRFKQAGRPDLAKRVANAVRRGRQRSAEKPPDDG